MSRIEDEWAKRIRRATPPAAAAPLAKQRLKREILSLHEARTAKRPLLKPALIAGAAGVAVLLAIVVLLPQRMSARERLRGLEGRYRVGLVPTATRYVRSEFGTDSNPGAPLVIETWTAGAGRARIRASRSGATVGHVLWLDGERYDLPAGRSTGMRLELRSAPAQAGSEKGFRHVWVLPGGKGPGGKALARVIVARGKLDPLAFASQSPVDVYGRLEANPGVEYLGREAGQAGEEAIEVFRGRSQSDLRCYAVTYDPAERPALSRFVQGLMAGNEAGAERHGGAVEVRPSPQGEPFVSGELEIEERVQIGRESGRIVGVEFVLAWKGETLERYRVSYREDAASEFRGVDFDPAALGLVQAAR